MRGNRAEEFFSFQGNRIKYSSLELKNSTENIVYPAYAYWQMVMDGPPLDNPDEQAAQIRRELDGRLQMADQIARFTTSRVRPLIGSTWFKSQALEKSTRSLWKGVEGLNERLDAGDILSLRRRVVPTSCPPFPHHSYTLPNTHHRTVHIGGDGGLAPAVEDSAVTSALLSTCAVHGGYPVLRGFTSARLPFGAR
ncbi:hypothetical protein CB1_000353017 [Camelus ferus]|nr:hypothetical protein CB1_000353017 [Camelus ferus]